MNEFLCLLDITNTNGSDANKTDATVDCNATDKWGSCLQSICTAKSVLQSFTVAYTSVSSIKYTIVGNNVPKTTTLKSRLNLQTLIIQPQT